MFSTSSIIAFLFVFFSFKEFVLKHSHRWFIASHIKASVAFPKTATFKIRDTPAVKKCLYDRDFLRRRDKKLYYEFIKQLRDADLGEYEDDIVSILKYLFKSEDVFFDQVDFVMIHKYGMELIVVDMNIGMESRGRSMFIDLESYQNKAYRQSVTLWSTAVVLSLLASWVMA